MIAVVELKVSVVVVIMAVALVVELVMMVGEGGLLW